MKALSVSPFLSKNRRGMTLVEVILGIAILAIMAVLAAGALFYPRWLTTESMLKQNAVHAATYAIEHLFAQDYVTIPDNPDLFDFSGIYGMNGRTVNHTDYSANEDPAFSYPLRLIHVEVTYPGRNDPVVLETYRSSL